MKLAELQQALRAADPAAVLVAPRVLVRVIQQASKLPNLIWRIPHRDCFVVARHVLFRYVDQDDLDLEPDQLLPPTVILLARPPTELLNNADPGPLLLTYWRRLFHATVHLTLESRCKEGTLSPADVRSRIDQIGAVEFEEIRRVLDQESYLLPDANEQAVYIEFAAVYLELRYFAANLLPSYFPGIRDFDAINRLLDVDLDAEALFKLTRLAGAPDPVLPDDTRSDEAHFYYWKLMQTAERAGAAGNVVRAAILHTKAARVAPAAQTHRTRELAEEDLKKLTQRLQAALLLTDQEAQEWLKDLPALLDKADQGSRPVEAEILFDLQKVCLDHEKDIYSLDLVEWVLSGGKRPIKRPLPGQRVVRINKHLRTAEQRLTFARLTDLDRQHFGMLLNAALQSSQEQLRKRFRPLIASALQDVGLTPTNPPERAAFHKIIEEMLDRIAAYGFLTFSDLRDTLSRNQLKLPDLGEPQEYVKGDPLLRLDRRLGTLLDGVYRPSEVYVRWLERLSALSFGTATGRAITQFFTIPFGTAFVVEEAVEMVLGHLGVPPLARVPHLLLILALGFFVMGFIHLEPLRRSIVSVALKLSHLLRVFVYDVVLEFVPLERIQWALGSWPAQLFYWYGLKPVVACLLLYYFAPTVFLQPNGKVAEVPLVCMLLATGIVLNSRFGLAFTDALFQGLVGAYELLRAGFLPGLFRLIVRAFKEVTEMLEYVLFTVDEWLRFRSGDSRLSLVVRTVLGVLWFPISYIARFYTVVLIEPGINPIKFPISSVGAKFIYPMIIYSDWMAWSTTHLGVFLNVILGATVWLLPDAFGFLFWETKENWSLYRANRRPTLEPEPIGAHGETVPRLLQPGFHSGTVPRLFARLRHAERDAAETNDWRATRAARHALQEVEKSVQLFVERDMIALLHESPSWHAKPLSAGPVELASNRIDVALLHHEFPDEPLWLAFEDRAGWLVAHVRQRGWLDRLSPEQFQSFTSALASLYKLAGADILLDQVHLNLCPCAADFDVSDNSLIVWLDRRQGKSLVYPLRDLQETLSPRTAAGEPARDGPTLEAKRVLFRRLPLYWNDWLETWQKDQDGQGHPRLFSGGVEVKVIAAPTPALVNGPDGTPEKDSRRGSDLVERPTSSNLPY